MLAAVEFALEHETLRGYLHTPLDSSRRVPGVVIIPGFADTAVGPHNLHVCLARALAEHGTAVLRFDYRGQGESEGDFRCFTARSGLEDARAALDFLRKQPNVEGGKLGIFGYSLGGALAAELSGEVPQIGALVLLAPVAYPEPVFTAFFEPHHLEQAEEQGWMDWLGWPVGAGFLPSLRSLHPLEGLKQSGAHTLVIHGTIDVEVPTENASAYAEQGAQLHRLEGGDHQFSSVRLQDEILAQTCSWFRSRLGET